MPSESHVHLASSLFRDFFFAGKVAHYMRNNLNHPSKITVTGSTLKWIAIITMLIDHIGASLIFSYMFYHGISFREASFINFLYQLTRSIGRISFPIFIFLLIEGFSHTRSVLKYLSRMFLFAVISEVPFDLAFYRNPYYPNSQNVFLTLFLGLLVIYGMDLIQKNVRLTNKNSLEINQISSNYFNTQLPEKCLIILFSTIILICGMALADLLHTDYSHAGILAITVAYLLRKNRRLAFCMSCLMLILFSSSSEVFALLGLFPILAYNGTRGRQMKYLFYFFYPVHLLVLYGLFRLFINYPNNFK